MNLQRPARVIILIAVALAAAALLLGQAFAQVSGMSATLGNETTLDQHSQLLFRSYTNPYQMGTGPQPQSSKAIIFEDDFSNPTESNQMWDFDSSSSGSHTVSGGLLRLMGSARAKSKAGFSSENGIVLKAEVRIIDGSRTTASWGIGDHHFLYQPPSFVACTYVSGDYPNCKSINGVNPGNWNIYEIKVDGSEVEFYANGDLQYSIDSGDNISSEEIYFSNSGQGSQFLVNLVELRTLYETPTNTPRPTSTPTNTPRPTSTSTNTPRPTLTPTFTPRPSATPTFTPRPSATPTNTPRPTSTPTNTPRPTATPTSTATPRPPELEILHIEITQAVQDNNNGISLYSDKDTTVRVYLTCTTNCVPGQAISGTLEVSGGNYLTGNSITKYPLNSISTSGVRGISNWQSVRRALDSSLNFRVEGNHLDGNVTFRVRVGDESATREVQFEDGHDLIIHVVPINVMGHGAPTAWAQIGSARGVARQLFPASYVEVREHSELEWDSCLGGVSCADWRKNLNDLQRELARAYADEPNEVVYGWIKSVEPLAGYDKDVLLSGDADYIGGIAAVGELGTSNQPYMVFLHEVGHLLRLRHANTSSNYQFEGCWTSSENVIDDQSNWLKQGRTTPLLDEYGVVHLPERGLEVFVPDGAGGVYNYEFMAYCGRTRDRWISRLYYESIAGELYYRNVLQNRNSDNAGAYFQVGGSVNRFSGGSLDPIVVKSLEVPPLNPPAGTSYCLESRASAGQVLDQHCFDLDFIDYESMSETDIDSFSVLMPHRNDAARVVLRKGNTTLAEISASANPPSVNITQPTGGANWGADGTYNVAWNASDADSDGLTFYVEYATDGVNFVPLGVSTTAQQITVDSSQIGGGSSARVRVIATDGFHTTIAESAPFNVARKGPQAYISGAEPGSGKIYVQPGTSLVLSGSGYDKEDGPLEGSALTWYSNRVSGSIGNGETLVTTLANGAHTITLRAEDSHGYVSSQSVEVFVGSEIFMPTMAGVSSGPTPPQPTPTPRPTATPRPTSSPMPTSAPTPSPTAPPQDLTEVIILSANPPNSDIYRIHLDGSIPYRLTSDGQGNGPVRISPDGTKIAFCKNGLLHSMTPLGLTTRLSNTPINCAASFSWSPDSSSLLVVGDVHGTGTGLYEFHISTGVFEAIPSVEQPNQPDWSPDGSKIVLIDDANWELVVQDSSGSNQHTIGLQPRLPAFSPNGTEIVYERYGSGLRIVKPNGQDERALPTGIYPQSPRWSPDGSSIVFVQGGTLKAIDSDGSNLRVISNLPASVEEVWSVDWGFVVNGG